MPARGFAAFGVAIRLDSLLLSAVAQPLAALPPYGCSVPLAGASPGFGLVLGAGLTTTASIKKP